MDMTSESVEARRGPDPDGTFTGCTVGARHTNLSLAGTIISDINRCPSSALGSVGDAYSSARSNISTARATCFSQLALATLQALRSEGTRKTINQRSRNEARDTKEVLRRAER